MGKLRDLVEAKLLEEGMHDKPGRTSKGFKLGSEEHFHRLIDRLTPYVHDGKGYDRAAEHVKGDLIKHFPGMENYGAMSHDGEDLDGHILFDHHSSQILDHYKKHYMPKGHKFK